MNASGSYARAARSIALRAVWSGLNSGVVFIVISREVKSAEIDDEGASKRRIRLRLRRHRHHSEVRARPVLRERREGLGGEVFFLERREFDLDGALEWPEVRGPVVAVFPVLLAFVGTAGLVAGAVVALDHADHAGASADQD